jgi:membrane-associated protein
MMHIVNIVLHLDKYLNMIIQTFGLGTYLMIFLILFCETGFVITPFLPGDSLIFTAGTICALGSLNVTVLFFVIALAAIAGDSANYAIGKYFGSEMLNKKNNKYIRKEHVAKAQDFYSKYGGLTIIIARFVPFIRNIAPFLAGIARMEYKKFSSYNVVGGTLWSALFLAAGYFLGSLLIVKNNMPVVIYGIIFVSVIPAVIGFVQQKLKKCSF